MPASTRAVAFASPGALKSLRQFIGHGLKVAFYAARAANQHMIVIGNTAFG